MSELGLALGQQIRRIRQSKGIAMERLAELASLSPTHVSEIERGRKEPSIQTLRKISVALHTRLADLVAPIEPDVGEKITKFEVLGRLERTMRDFYSEEELLDLLERTKTAFPIE